jgi:hypothetical protein
MNSTEDGTCLESLGIAARICVDIFPPLSPLLQAKALVQIKQILHVKFSSLMGGHTFHSV